MTVKGLGPSWCGIKFESLGNHDSLPWMIASKRVLNNWYVGRAQNHFEATT